MASERAADAVADAVAEAVQAAFAAASALPSNDAALTPSSVALPVDPDLADDLAAVQLAYDLADWLDAPVDEVWSLMCGKPAAMMKSPQGWSVMAELVAMDLGAPSPGYAPTVH